MRNGPRDFPTRRALRMSHMSDHPRGYFEPPDFPGLTALLREACDRDRGVRGRSQAQVFEAIEEGARGYVRACLARRGAGGRVWVTDIVQLAYSRLVLEPAAEGAGPHDRPVWGSRADFVAYFC